jgi:hypothetical protein
VVGRIDDDVRRELKRFGPAAGMAELVAAWPRLVGDQIAHNAWPARFGRDGTLYIATSSSAWAFELTQLQGEILERLRQGLEQPPPAGLRFFPGKLPETDSAEAEEPAREPVDPTPEQRERGAALAAQIEDEDLRKLVAKAAAASLSRPPDGRSVW